MACFKVPWCVRMECGRGGGDLRIQSICLDPCVCRCFCVVENHQPSDFRVHPTQLLCIIPVPIVRWVLVGIAFGLSGYFLFANVYPVLAAVSANPRNKFRCTAVLFWRSVFPGAPGHSWTDHSVLHICLIGRSQSHTSPCSHYIHSPRRHRIIFQGPLLQQLYSATYWWR